MAAGNTKFYDQDSTNRDSDLHQDLRGQGHQRHGTNKHMLGDDNLDNFGDRAGPGEQRYQVGNPNRSMKAKDLNKSAKGKKGQEGIEMGVLDISSKGKTKDRSVKYPDAHAIPVDDY